MSFFRKMFGEKSPERGSASATASPSSADPANDPNMIRVYDGYGRELFITKQQWKDNVLLGNLETARNNPEQLYGMLVGALHDGFAADIIPYAEHLWRTDPIPSRGAAILGIVYMDVNRLDDAERVLSDFIAAHGEDGVVLTNLAKVDSRRGDNARAESILWHALEVDPNQDNGLGWYAAIQRDRGGEPSASDAFRRVAALPRSWRAQLWLARDAVQGKDFPAAEPLYMEALRRAEQPVPTDLLMQMSGDLGNNGYLAEIIRLVEPYFDPAFHGLQVGNNLIKSNYDLGQLDAARRILGQLYAQKRHDWQQTLSYWDTELAKAGIAKRADTVPEQLSVSLVSIEGPLWTRDGSPFAALLPVKRANAQHIAVLGSTAVLAQVPERPAIQLSDGPGRLSRAVPLILAEKIHLTTDAAGFVLIPWAQNQGFALFGRPYADQALCDLGGKNEKAPDFMVAVTLDATQSRWNLALRLVRREDGHRIAEARVEAASENPGPAVERLAAKLLKLLAKHASVRAYPAPTWYQIPVGQDSSDYLLRLEQQLAVACMHLDFLKGGGLSGERELLDGILQLCVRQPTNQTVRMIFAQTLHQIQKVRSEILPEYREKIDLLQRDHPIAGDVAQLVENAITEAFGS
ncbi:MAG: tetratricopeptide repeat protein [Gammaproteobacteria bacterium]